jgi:hypothetical protein
MGMEGACRLSGFTVAGGIQISGVDSGAICLESAEKQGNKNLFEKCEPLPRDDYLSASRAIAAQRRIADTISRPFGLFTLPTTWYIDAALPDETMIRWARHPAFAVRSVGCE